MNWRAALLRHRNFRDGRFVARPSIEDFLLWDFTLVRIEKLIPAGKRRPNGFPGAGHFVDTSRNKIYSRLCGGPPRQGATGEIICGAVRI
jgi:hypothetical protein